MRSLHPSLVVAIAALLLLPGLAYFGLRLTLPGDPSSPAVDFLSIQPGELAVRPISPQANGLQNGDIVTAIQGRGVDEYLQGMFSAQRIVAPADTIQYTVLRDGQALHIEAPLKTPSLLQLVKENWSIYIYLIYLELVSLLVFILRPRLAVAQLFFVVSNVLLSSSLAFFHGLEVSDLLYRWVVILYLFGAVALYGLILPALVHFSLIFPKPNPLLARRPRLLTLIYLGVWIPLVAYLAARWPALASPASRLLVIVQGTSLMSAVYFPLLLVATVSSYRAGNDREKRQIRWVMWSLMISLVPYLAFSVLPALLGVKFQIATSVLGILWSTLPTAFAIAVLHERLFDIDVIIRRTLLYSALTLILGAVYYFSILLLQRLFQVFTGQNESPLTTVLSTLLIAALFTPLRRWIQNYIDRRFYRRKYDAEKILKEFAGRLRNEVELERITEDLLNAAEETMKPRNLSVWIRKGS